jgi:predicted lipid-binding transport protein (Tim44 family)
MKLDTWHVTHQDGGTVREGDLWVDEAGVHFTSEGAVADAVEGFALFVDYVDITAVEVDGDQLRIAALDDQDEERGLTVRPHSEATAGSIQTRIAALQAEYTEDDEHDEHDEQEELEQNQHEQLDEASSSAEHDDELQFDQAEYDDDRSSAATCTACQQQIARDYYEINGAVVCQACKAAVDASRSPAGGGLRFLKALVLGVLAAGLGAGIYFGVAALTGYEIGLVAVVVGFLVGGAVRMGSEHRGGAGYQALAILLTYFAIVGTYIPLIVRASDAPQQQASIAADKPVAQTVSAGSAANPSQQPAPELERGAIYWIFVVGFAAIWPFAALYFDGLGQILGLLIVGFAVYEAWKLNKRPKITITGPFSLGPDAGPDAGSDTGLDAGPAAAQPVPSDG